jgi:hypothetical protein
VTVNVPVPFVSVLAGGSPAPESELENWTVPEYPVAVLLAASRAVTLIEKLEPEYEEAGAFTPKWVVGPEPTAMPAEEPEM